MRLNNMAMRRSNKKADTTKMIVRKQDPALEKDIQPLANLIRQYFIDIPNPYTQEAIEALMGGFRQSSINQIINLKTEAIPVYTNMVRIAIGIWKATNGKVQLTAEDIYRLCYPNAPIYPWLQSHHQKTDDQDLDERFINPDMEYVQRFGLLLGLAIAGSDKFLQDISDDLGISIARIKQLKTGLFVPTVDELLSIGESEIVKITDEKRVLGYRELLDRVYPVSNPVEEEDYQEFDEDCIQQVRDLLADLMGQESASIERFWNYTVRDSISLERFKALMVDKQPTTSELIILKIGLKKLGYDYDLIGLARGDIELVAAE